MVKLYRSDPNGKVSYWETWDKGDGTFVIHSGEIGDRGETEEVSSTFFSTASKKIEKLIEKKKSEGFEENDHDSESALLVEYAVDGFGADEDLDKRHRLEDRLNETLGWTGLGMVDGGSIGSGTMEVCAYVVDFEIAKAVIERDLANTEFADYSRIYDEDA